MKSLCQCLENVTILKLENLYFFLKNFLVISKNIIDKHFLNGFIKFNMKNINNFNISNNQLSVLEKNVGEEEFNMSNFIELVKNAFKGMKKDLQLEIYRIKSDLAQYRKKNNR